MSLILGALLWALSTPCHSACLAATSSPPTRRQALAERSFGLEVADPYRWLEDGQAPEVQAWVQAQDAACDAALAAMGSLSATAAGLQGLPMAERYSLPERQGHWLYFTRQRPGEDQPRLLRQAEGGAEEPLLDPNAWAPERHAVLGSWYPSPDGRFVAYALRLNNADQGELRVRDLASGEEADGDRQAWAEWADFAWAPDSRGYYFTRLPPAGSVAGPDLPGRSDLAYHALGQPRAAERRLLPASGDPQVYESPQVSDDGRWLFLLRAHGFGGSDILALGLAQPQAPPLELFHSASATAKVLEDGGRFFLLTALGAPHGALQAREASAATATAWTLLVPERPDVTLDAVSIVGHQLVLLAHRDAASLVECRSPDGLLLSTLRLPSQGFVGGLSGRAGDAEGFLSFESFTRPMELQRFDPVSGRLRLWQRPASVPEAVRQAQVSQAWFTSADGTRVPMFLLRPQGLPQDGSAAFVLEGYGGFGASLLPRYSPLTAALLQAGFGVALPSLRGGGEYGEAWHQGGMLLNKQNTFDDFAAAARYLAEQRYSSPKRLAILGNSNGGLLVAAALTQHPELFGAAICGSPLTDMLRYPRFGEGAAWVSEYGDPADEAQFKALAAYSPYHHVTAGTAYPPTLIYCAEDDDRVDPMHARKFAAALQSAQAGPGPVLLRTQRHAGHGGAGSTSGRQGLLAQELTFLQSALACPGAAPAMRALGPGSKP